MTEIHDSNTCEAGFNGQPCKMCLWAARTAQNRQGKENGQPEAKNVSYSPVVASTASLVESSLPNFEREWSHSPRAMTAYVEHSIAEYWFLCGMRAGEVKTLLGMNADLREIIEQRSIRG